MFAAGMAAILAALVLYVARALMGPTTFDRLAAANAVGTAAILMLALYGFFIDRPEFLDIAITYSLLNVIGTFAVLKFFRYGTLGAEGDAEEDGR